jgi:hypothetical protein
MVGDHMGIPRTVVLPFCPTLLIPIPRQVENIRARSAGGITTGFPGTTSVPVPKYKTPVRQAVEQNRITLESVVPEIFGPDLNSAEPHPVVPLIATSRHPNLNPNHTSTSLTNLSPDRLSHPTPRTEHRKFFAPPNGSRVFPGHHRFEILALNSPAPELAPLLRCRTRP